MRIRGAIFALAMCMAVTSARAEFYDLERAVGVSLDVSTQVGISYEQLQQRRSTVLTNYGALMPDLRLSFYSGQSFIGPSAQVAVDAQGRPIPSQGLNFNAYNFSINSAMTLFDWGSSYSGLKQARGNAEAAGYDLEYQKDFVKALVIREYYDYVKRSSLRKVQQDDVEAKRRNLEQVEAFYKIGSRTKADFLQARVDYANSGLTLLNAENAEALASVRLKNRLNVPLASEIEVNESLAVEPQEVDLNAEIQYMLAHRSDLLAGRERVKASKNGIKAAERSLLPSLAANFSYGWNDRKLPDNNFNFFEQDYSWGIGLSVSYNAFDRFQTKSSIENSRAQHRIAEYNLQQSKLDAILDVRQIVLNLAQARERLALASETVIQAEESLRLAQERYRVGAGTVLETINANAQLTRAQASLIEAQIDLLINRADLQRATGRPITAQ